MGRAVARLALILVMAAPMLVSQEAPPPPPKPQTPAPAKPPRRAAGQSWVFAGSSGSYLGIDPRDITADRVAPLKLKGERGVEVAMVDQDSPAGKAGLKEHDVILTLNGQNVESVEELKRMLREIPPGRSVALGISRDGNPLTLNVTLGDRSKLGMSHTFVMPDVRIPPMPEIPDIPAIMVMTTVGRNGIMVEPLTPQLGDFFGVKNGQGVLVRSIEKGTPGEAAGLKAGDVIVGAGSERVADVNDWRRVVRGHAGATVQLRVLRDKREITLPLAVPKRRDSGALGHDWDLFLPDLGHELQDLRPELERIRAVELAQLQRELQLHHQEVERATQQTRIEIQRSMRAQRQEMEKAQRELEKAQKELQREPQQQIEKY